VALNVRFELMQGQVHAAHEPELGIELRLKTQVAPASVKSIEAAAVVGQTGLETVTPGLHTPDQSTFPPASKTVTVIAQGALLVT